MSVEINFYISDDEFSTMMALKEQAGKRELTGNDYAQEIFKNAIYRLEKEWKREASLSEIFP